MENKILLIRKELGLSQKEFGKKMGCSRDRIANIELGRVSPDNLFITHLCSVYSVNEKWLRTDKGKMFSPVEENLDYLIAKYGDGLSDNMKAAVKTLLLMPEEKRKVFDEFLDEFDKLRNIKKDQD